MSNYHMKKPSRVRAAELKVLKAAVAWQKEYPKMLTEGCPYYEVRLELSHAVIDYISSIRPLIRKRGRKHE